MFQFKGEYFEVVVQDEFDLTAGEKGWIELHLENRNKFGLYKLFVLTLSNSKDLLTLWIREPVHGQLFTYQFIQRVFKEVGKCLAEEYGLNDLNTAIGARLYTSQMSDFEKDMETLLDEAVEVLF